MSVHVKHARAGASLKIKSLEKHEDYVEVVFTEEIEVGRLGRRPVVVNNYHYFKLSTKEWQKFLSRNNLKTDENISNVTFVNT